MSGNGTNPQNNSHEGVSQGQKRTPDRRTTNNTEQLATGNVAGRGILSPYSDMYHAAPLEALRYSEPPQLLHGVILYSLPWYNWYQVQLDEGAATIGCCDANSGNAMPIGVNSSSMYPAGSNVVVWYVKSLGFGMIIGSWPRITTSRKGGVPDWVQQAGGSGFKRELAYNEPKRFFKDRSGIVSFNANRPVDQTSLDWGHMAETGVGIHIDPFMTFMRVNEMCGLFLNYFDSYTRLAGLNMDIMAPGIDFVSRDDEGETNHYEGSVVYPWEGLGLLKPGEQIHKEYEAEDVLVKKLKSTFDEKEGEEGYQAFHRYREYGGYLGQGRLRMVVAPGREEGKQLYTDDPKENPDYGLFREAIGLDGTYLLQSARQLFISKRVLIPVPKQLKLPEDPTGDSKEEDNYKFSGEFGSGEEHVISTVAPSEGENRHIMQMAAILDVMAYEHNWRPLHAFHYHVLDYGVPEESDYTKGPTRVLENLDFGSLSSQTYMAPPEPKKIKIDSRYGEVDYFEREAGIALLPDGGILIYDGYGSEIAMVGGSIRMSCPGDVQLTPGRQLVALSGNDLILRAHESVDITAGNKDLRLKAEKNLHMLGGNDGSGGVLIESKARSRNFDFDNKIGEDVSMSGITLKCKGPITQLAGEIYLRTGKGDLNNGKIVIDSGRGSSGVEIFGSTINNYASSTVAFYLGPQDTNSNVSTPYYFSRNAAYIGATTQIKGTTAIDGSLVVDGSVAARAFGGVINPFVGKLDAAVLQKASNQVQKTDADLKKAGKKLHEAIFTKDLYKTKQPGDNATIEKIAFSLRDDNEQAQYNSQTFTLAESRWQTMVRLGLATGGSNWSEPTVSYQGNDQLPWPGKKKWEDEDTLLQLEELTLFDASNGVDKDRTDDAYQDPQLAGETGDTPANAYKIIS